jgi:hypothetical protein
MLLLYTLKKPVTKKKNEKKINLPILLQWLNDMVLLFVSFLPMWLQFHDNYYIEIIWNSIFYFYA